ncbi:MAG: response regulator [Burkholderiales bacterium]|nr:response regulator [Burkholderiales bacterium]
MKEKTAHILVVEDDLKIAQVLRDYLHAAGYVSEHSDHGQRALERLQTQAFDLVLLDRMLPGIDGVQLCQRLRSFSQVPVIMLTAMIEEDDKLDGLEAGADDYVCKPFSPREVVARVKAQLRRSAFLPTQKQTSAFVVNELNMSITAKGNALNLTPVEFRLLSAMITHPGRVYTRQQLLNLTSEDYRDSGDRTIDSHIKNIRKKIAQVSDLADSLQSVYGVGYRFECSEF